MGDNPVYLKHYQARDYCIHIFGGKVEDYQVDEDDIVYRKGLRMGIFKVLNNGIENNSLQLEIDFKRDKQPEPEYKPFKRSKWEEFKYFMIYIFIVAVGFLAMFTVVESYIEMKIKKNGETTLLHGFTVIEKPKVEPSDP